MLSNAVKTIAFSLLFGTLTLSAVGCGVGYEREEIGEEEREEVIGEEGIGEEEEREED